METTRVNLSKAAEYANSLPLVSVITVVFNGEDHIGRCIQSVKEQGYARIQHVIVDGGSGDRTMQIILENKDSKCIVISEKDDGMYDALNKGLRVASGDIVGVLNSDDVFVNNNVLQHIVDEINNNGFNTYCGSVEIVNSSGKIKRAYDASRFRMWQLVMGHMPPHPGFYIRRTLLDKVGDYDTDMKMSSDFDFVLRTLNHELCRVRYSSHVIVRMLTGGQSNRGIKSIVAINRDIVFALKKNGYSVWWPLFVIRTVMKYLGVL